MEYIKENGKIWDERSENNDTWSIPVTSEMIELARKGNWSILLTPTKSVPLNWFPEKLHEKKILCLASGGGQQGPILAATGADVTVFDNSLKQLEKDEFVAQRDNLKIKTLQGNMQDLSIFEDEEPEECQSCKKGNNHSHTGIYSKIMNWDTKRSIKFSA